MSWRLSVRVASALARGRQQSFSFSFFNDVQMPMEMLDAADEAFSMALDLCGNEGQVSVIEMTGMEAFIEAARAAWHENDPFTVLLEACPYPEAVTLILEEVAMFMGYRAEEIAEEIAEEQEEYDLY